MKQRARLLLRRAALLHAAAGAGLGRAFGRSSSNHAARYFPLVGIVVGAIGAAVTELAVLALPIGIAVVLGMAATVLATGGFHEDGFADACDGFGGGWDKAQVLAIMKDSRVGSYATIGLGSAAAGQMDALVELDGAFGRPSWRWRCSPATRYRAWPRPC
jgi:cobalamin synthase